MNNGLPKRTVIIKPTVRGMMNGTIGVTLIFSLPSLRNCSKSSGMSSSTASQEPPPQHAGLSTGHTNLFSTVSKGTWYV